MRMRSIVSDRIMFLPVLFSGVRGSMRIIVAILLLLLFFSPGKTSFAEEVTFAGKYSLQVPDGWTVKERLKMVFAIGPNGAELHARVEETDLAIEDLVAKAAAELKGDPQYGTRESASVPHPSAGQAHFARVRVPSRLLSTAPASASNPITRGAIHSPVCTQGGRDPVGSFSDRARHVHPQRRSGYLQLTQNGRRCGGRRVVAEHAGSWVGRAIEIRSLSRFRSDAACEQARGSGECRPRCGVALCD